MSRSKKLQEASGLVISSKTGGQPTEQITLEDLKRVKEKLPEVEALPPDTRQSSHFVSLSPASIQISKKDPKLKKSVNYQARKPINAWSAKSRSNMVSRFLTLDYSPIFNDKNRIPALITLTYPSDWESVVPDGTTFKRHVKALLKRYEVAFDEKLRGLWKMEFQRRGAPHLHVMTSIASDVPHLRSWLSKNWADIVNHPDPSERTKHEGAGTRIDEWHDFKTFQAYLIAVYFSKHSSPSGFSVKNYQNRVPELWAQAGNVGRFWGYWGLSPAVAKVQVSEEDALFVKRTLRRWHEAKTKAVRVRVRRINQRTGVVRYRWTKRKLKRLKGKGGYMSVPDGVAMGELLALALESRRTSPVLEQSHEVGNLGVLRFDRCVSNSQFGVLFSQQHQQLLVLCVKLLDTCYRTTSWLGFSSPGPRRQRGVRRQPTHVYKSGTWNTPHTMRQISPPSVKLSFIRFVSEFRRGTPRQTHCLGNGIKRLFNVVFSPIHKAIRNIFHHKKIIP